MAEINQLNTVATPSGSDLLALWSQADGATRKISFTNFLAWLNDQAITTQDNKVTQYSAPVTGATVTIGTTGSIWLVLTPAGTIATLTLTLPLSTDVADKTELLVNSTNIVTTLTIAPNGATVVGGPTTIAANGFFRLRFDTVLQTWYRVG